MYWQRIRRATLCLCGWAAGGIFALTAWGQQTPFRVPVASDVAIVHSGPGETHYGTARLERGVVVDVYREDPGGWMAIRPPEGSFSLVQANQIELMEDGLARVIASDAVAWVGTRLDAVEKPMWQVRLRQGEVVEVLGIVDRQKYELGTNEPDWVQIMPPAGEFRWIAATDLDMARREVLPQAASDSTGEQFADNSEPVRADGGWSTDAADGPVPRDLHLAPPPVEMTVRARGEGGDQAIPPIASRTQPPDADSDWSLGIEPENDSDDWSDFVSPVAGSVSPGNRAPAAEPADSGWQPARQSIANFVNERSQFIADSSAPPPPGTSWTGEVQSADAVYNRAALFDSDPAYSSGYGQPNLTAAAGIAPAGGGNPVTNLELRLTQEMLRHPTEWNLVDIAREAQRLRDATADPAMQGAADRLLEKIRSCREIQSGFQAVDGPHPEDLETQAPTPGTLHASHIGPAGGELLHEYDAFGWLNELVRDGGMGAPTWVLQDDQGRITHQVTAPPGLNLRRWLNQRVGIIGTRGYNQQLNLNHVTAERIIAVDQLRR